MHQNKHVPPIYKSTLSYALSQNTQIKSNLDQQQYCNMNISLSNFLISSHLFLILFLTSSHAATFDIRNQCPYTVWAAASPGGGRRLDPGQSWSLYVAPGTKEARIWGRTNCNFDSAGRGNCQTGDCGGVLECTGYGVPPNTLAEFALNQWNNLDFIDMSLIDGFNIPMDFSPINSAGCNTQAIRCTANILGECPNELRVPGGCQGPCTVFKTPEYCCTNGPGTCGATYFSRFFKDRCPNAYSYPQDDATSMFACPGGTNYRIVFCPSSTSTYSSNGNTDVIKMVGSGSSTS